MMPTLAIMAMAVASAATITEVRESDAASPRPASRPSAPKSRRKLLRLSLASSRTRPAAQRPARTRRQGSAEHQPHHGGPAGTQRAQDADLRPPPYHAHRNRVVDEEGADHQRDVAQHTQIPAKGAQHTLVLFSAHARLVERIRRREHGADFAFETGEVLARRDEDIDAVQFAVGAEGFLRVGDV